MKEASFCCKAFEEQATDHEAFAGGGGLYPVGMRPDTQFEQDDDGTWNVNGCCGGGCYVVSGMRFCPFCGSSLSPSDPKEG
jgi:hypothetical protein